MMCRKSRLSSFMFGAETRKISSISEEKCSSVMSPLRINAENWEGVMTSLLVARVTLAEVLDSSRLMGGAMSVRSRPREGDVGKIN